MSVGATLKATWRWWAPPLVLLVLLAGGLAAWIAAVPDSPIEYAVP